MPRALLVAEHVQPQAESWQVSYGRLYVVLAGLSTGCSGIGGFGVLCSLRAPCFGFHFVAMQRLYLFIDLRAYQYYSLVMLRCSKMEVVMPKKGKLKTPPVHSQESSFVSSLSGWMQQGVESFLATQRTLVDLVMSQNAAAMDLLRGRLWDPHFRPAAAVTELVGNSTFNFIEAQRVLLQLAHQENEIVMTGVKDRVDASAAAAALTNLLRRSIDTCIELQQDFLKIASKQTHVWLDAVTAGKTCDGEGLVELAREGMDDFVLAQKKFLDVVAEETAAATNGKEGASRKGRKTELPELARQATGSFISAQKKLLDVAGRQMNVNLKAASHTMNMITPFPFLPIPDMTRKGVQSLVDAEKALLDTVTERRGSPKVAGKTVRRKKRSA